MGIFEIPAVIDLWSYAHKSLGDGDGVAIIHKSTGQYAKLEVND